MTVKQLIEELQKFPPESRVVYPQEYGTDAGTWMTEEKEITNVTCYNDTTVELN